MPMAAGLCSCTFPNQWRRPRQAPQFFHRLAAGMAEICWYRPTWGPELHSILLCCIHDGLHVCIPVSVYVPFLLSAGKWGRLTMDGNNAEEKECGSIAVKWKFLRLLVTENMTYDSGGFWVGGGKLLQILLSERSGRQSLSKNLSFFLLYCSWEWCE